MGILLEAVALLATKSILAPLDQRTTNGLSLLGTLSTPLLPQFLTDNPLPNGTPWGLNNTQNTNPYHNSPTSGVTRQYDFTVSRNTLSPDGFERQLITINGMYPGPMIEANWGDTIQVTVHNNITEDPEGTSLHFHGFLQHRSQWMDGTPGISQCPIAPSKTLTYSFKAELFGTSWYHSHYSSQYIDGVFGPVVVYGPQQDQSQYDYDLGPITLNDYHHVDYYTITKTITSPRPNQPPLNPTSDNNLINGKMNFDCSLAPPGSKCRSNAGVAKFRFTSGKRHRLRLINTGADATQQFSIDGHTMEVIANDFVTIQPYNTTIITLGVGQRTDVIVRATGDPKSAYWMRSNITCASSNAPNALAVVYYENACTTLAPNSLPQAYNASCANDDLSQTVPTYPINPGVPAVTIYLEMSAAQNGSFVWLWYMNNSTFRTDYSAPVLELANAGVTSYADPQWNIYDMGTNSSYRFVVSNNSPLAHPMHLHGHNMYILAVGDGLSWDGEIVNPRNPQRRDVQMVPAGGHFVWQADADNPGAWPFHCHMVWHSSTGFSIDILEQPLAITHLNIPPSMNQICKDWNAFAATGQVDQIDSGLKN